MEIRIWDKEMQTMFYSDKKVKTDPNRGDDYAEPIGVGLDGKVIARVEGDHGYHSFYNDGSDRFVVMVCIGRQDSAGRKTFEGDIIKYHRASMFVGTEIHFEVTTAPIAYDQNNSQFMLLKDGKFESIPGSLSLNSHFTIVGNIYQNDASTL